MALKIKICGMRDAANIAEVAALKPDYLGFIFYPKSARYIGGNGDSSMMNSIADSIERVGVFVNETNAHIEAISKTYSLNTIQLHGSETPEQCMELKEKGYTVFKAFQIDDDTLTAEVLAYKGYCDYFLYDTKSKGLGGSGLKFNWNKLEELNDAGAFFLSGGITVDDAATIKELPLSNLYGVDINSKFEIKPALKNVTLLKAFIKDIR